MKKQIITHPSVLADAVHVLGASEIDDLRMRLQEAEDTIEAIRGGSVDALVVSEQDKHHIYTLKSADHTYRVLIESMNQAAMTISENGTILYSNSQFSRMVQQPLESIIGALLPDFVKDIDRPLLQKLIKPTGVRLVTREMECDLTGEIQLSVLISATELPPVDANAYMSVVITDITDLKRADKAKDEFISLASHQLRTPATGVKQYLGMLLEGYAGDLEEGQKAFISTAYNSNEKQLAIINSILRTAQIDSGIYKLKKSPQNLAALIDMVLIDFQPVMLMRQQIMVASISENIEVDVDQAEMTVALANLIENASKYSPNGKQISIMAKQSASATSITVRDQGVGIAEADQAKIFEKFTRVNNPMSDTVNGSGLGLYWVKRIIVMHGGTIIVKSNLGKGTDFIVRLPR